MGNCVGISVMKVEREKRNKNKVKKRKVGGGCCCVGRNGEIQKIYDEITASDGKNII